MCVRARACVHACMCEAPTALTAEEAEKMIILADWNKSIWSVMEWPLRQRDSGVHSSGPLDAATLRKAGALSS